MKKNLIIAIGFVLIFAHIIPPYNIVFANDEENTCEMSDFTVQTIKETDEKIKGTGMPSGQLTIEFKSKNKTQSVNVNSSGKFELIVEEEFLEVNDVITISNEYFKVETKVESGETASQSIQSSQYVECPVIEVEPEEPILEQVTTPEEILKESVVEEEVTTPEESVVEEEVTTPEESVVEEEVTELNQDSEESVVEEKIAESESILIENPIEQSYRSELQILNLAGIGLFDNNQLEVNYEEKVLRLKNTASGLLDLNLISSTYFNFYLPTEFMETGVINNIVGKYTYTGTLHSKSKTFNMDEIIRNGNHIYMSIQEPLSVVLFPKLIMELEITLNEFPKSENGEFYFQSLSSGNNAIDINLFSGNRGTAKLYFPNISTIEAPVYNTDNVINGTGDAESRIILTAVGLNKVYEGEIDSSGNFSIVLDNPLPIGTEIKAVVLSKEDDRSEEASVTVIKRLEPPILEDVYSNETQIKGTGEPNKDVEITIGSTTYNGMTDENGHFSIKIGTQLPDTVINAILIDEYGGKSEPAETIVLEGAISFHNVPGTIAFATTEISLGQGKIKIDRENPNWALEVSDTRRPGSNISILAEEVKPLTASDSTHTLPGALVYLDSNSNSTSLNEGAKEVFSGTTQEESIHSFGWEDDQGILIEVNPLTVRPESYSGTINWTINNGP